MAIKAIELGLRRQEVLMLKLIIVAVLAIAAPVLATGCGGSQPDCPDGCVAHYYWPPGGGAGHWECDPVGPGNSCPGPDEAQ